jgi:sterol desaturase/sphingolipid hydroxylase (fatty acid hydroxylase superfamily)
MGVHYNTDWQFDRVAFFEHILTAKATHLSRLHHHENYNSLDPLWDKNAGSLARERQECALLDRVAPVARKQDR